MDEMGFLELVDLPVLPLRITAVAVDAIRLPDNSGSTLRGAFGRALKDLVCVHREREACPGCEVESRCAYVSLFEPTAPPGAPGFSGVRDLPRPFVIRGPSAGSVIERGEPWCWEVTLIGRGVEALPYFVLAWRQMGERGLGQGRGRFDLQRIDALDLSGTVGEAVFAAPDRVLRPPVPVAVERAGGPAVTTAVVDFRTPTLIRSEGRTCERPEFSALWKALQLRLSLLRLAHGEGRPRMDFRAALEAAGEVRLREWSGERSHWERFSARQGRRVPMRGWVGRAVYEGDLTPFWPALRLGAWVGVGDNCTFGQGHYVIATP